LVAKPAGDTAAVYGISTLPIFVPTKQFRMISATRHVDRNKGKMSLKLGKMALRVDHGLQLIISLVSNFVYSRVVSIIALHHNP
jgi:hypothetical protein